MEVLGKAKNPSLVPPSVELCVWCGGGVCVCVSVQLSCSLPMGRKDGLQVQIEGSLFQYASMHRQ